MKTFAIIGSAGYIAPKHMKAIKETGNKLVASVDKHDSVGILDSYFPESDFFTEFERFDRHLYKLKQKGEQIDYVTICSPNYLHDSHIRYALRYGAKVICEKPLVLNPWNLDVIEEMDGENKVSAILQLRLHPAMIELKKWAELIQHKPYIRLEYLTPRGHWYDTSWKGDESKSGGLLTNIGIHLFDMLLWIFGPLIEFKCNKGLRSFYGNLKLQNAEVDWFLGINSFQQDIVMRKMTIDSVEIDFTKGFNDLHTKSYEEILKGNGFTIHDARPAIELVHKLRTSL